MTKQVSAEVESKEFEWRFRIVDITPFFSEIRGKVFTKIREDDNLYTCDEEHHSIVEGYIKNGLLTLEMSNENDLTTPNKTYKIEDGHFVVYESKRKVVNGIEVWDDQVRSITDDFYIAIDTDITFDDGIEETHRYKGRIIVNNGANEFKFNVDSRVFATSQEMAKELSNIGGMKVVFDNNNLKDIRIATQRTSKFESRKVSQVFGWQGKVYRAQSSMIFPGGVVAGESNVDLSDIPIARNLDILAISDKEFKEVGKHIVNDMLNLNDRYVIDCLFGFTFLAPIASQIAESDDWDGGRIGMWLVGGSGCGKSYTALRFQHFFGIFKGKNPVFGWLGTPFSIQEGGYFFKDALFMVDDFKIEHFTQNGLDQAVMILQNYTDGTSRTRLNAGMELSEGKPIRGAMLITGEDVIENVTSVMARYHLIKMSKEHLNRAVGKTTKKYKKLYSGFMGRYIAWLMKDPKAVSKIVNRIESIKEEMVGDRNSANIDRVAQSFAYNLVGFDMFCQFLEKNSFISTEKSKKMVKTHKNNLLFHIDQNVADVRAATVGEVFMSTLRDLINSGSARIHFVEDKNDLPPSYGKGVEYIGFVDQDEYVYLFGSEALGAVNASLKVSTGKGLMNTKQNLLGELVRMGVLFPHINGKGEVEGNRVNKRYYGKVIPTWRILKSALGYEKEEVIEEDMEGW